MPELWSRCLREKLPGPTRYKSIPSAQWDALDRFWQMRRSEVLADLQVWTEHGGNPPPEEIVPQSQTSFVGTTQNRSNLMHEMRVPGYSTTAESFTDLMNNHPEEFARVALTARQKSVSMTATRSYGRVYGTGDGP